MDAEEQQHIESLLKQHRRRLRLLEQRVAKFGTNAPAELIIEIEDLQVIIDQLQTRLHAEEQNSHPSPESKRQSVGPVRRDLKNNQPRAIPIIIALISAIAIIGAAWITSRGQGNSPSASPTISTIVSPTTSIVATTSSIQPTLTLPIIASTPIPAVTITSAPATLATTVAQQIEQTVALLLKDAQVSSGPTDGELIHDTKRSGLNTYGGLFKLSDFIAEVRFYNPFDSVITKQLWDYGIVFRGNDENHKDYRIIIRADKTWSLIINDNSKPGTSYSIENGGTIKDMDTSENGFNDIRLIIKGERGFFFVNNKYIATLDVSKQLNTGPVHIATSIYAGSNIDGKSTRFQDFVIYSL